MTYNHTYESFTSGETDDAPAWLTRQIAFSYNICVSLNLEALTYKMKQSYKEATGESVTSKEFKAGLARARIMHQRLVKLPQRVELYRLVVLDSIDDFQANSPGNYFVLSPTDFTYDFFEYMDLDISDTSKLFIFKLDIDRSRIDFMDSLTQTLYSDEREIRVPYNRADYVNIHWIKPVAEVEEAYGFTLGS